MAETKTKTQASTGPGDAAPSVLHRAAETVQNALGGSTNGDTDGSENQPPAPAGARSFAGSGTTEARELLPETHGTHYRGPQGDI